MKAIKFTMMLGLLAMATVSFAQGSPPATPIDGGLSFLLAGGAALGIRALMKKKG